ncbi:MAG: HAD family acid phosphatase [Metamycoplasmataceae bacterium]
MKLNKRILFGGLALASVAPMISLSAACVNENKVEGKKEFTYQDFLTFFQKKFPTLTDAQKQEFVDSLDTKNILTQQQKVEIIQKLNKNAGKIGSVVWFVKSAEAKVAQLQSYALAKAAFDNLIKNAENKFDLTKVNHTTGSVTNPENGKFIPAVFMDIDETVFANDYSEAKSMRDGFKPSDKEQYDIKGIRKAIPGAIDFINYVFEKGGQVFFNSNMNQKKEVIEGLKKNLERAGVKKQYIKDWMFWLKQVNPIKGENSYDDAPWMQMNGRQNISKNTRMNAMSDNTEGWNFKKSDANSGDKVKLRVTMKIGDDFNDFYDDAYKYLPMEERNKYIDTIKELLTKVEGTKGKRYDNKTKTFTELEWQQFLVQTPSNAMYGGWEKQLNYGEYKTLWEQIEKIINDPKDLKE